MSKIKKIYFILILFFVISLVQCKKSSSPALSEHTYSINRIPVFIQQLTSNNSETKKTKIILFIKEDENLEQVRFVFEDFLNDGYSVAILKADWGNLLTAQLNSSEQNENINSTCNLIKSLLEKDEQTIIMMTGELACASYYLQTDTDCSEGLILISPYCNNENLITDSNIKELFYFPTLIIVGENDEKSYNFSLQLYQKNRSLCELRSYPTDEHSFTLLYSSLHAREQIKLWIETITKKQNKSALL
ncbi:MAG TPA: hypothetical protein PLX23_04260 [Candidatus Hydrogenedens sp.]|nr:hypothetical protein [Candidatus Hydrogenedens sp.]